jgi:hypothetical protein
VLCHDPGRRCHRSPQQPVQSNRIGQSCSQRVLWCSGLSQSLILSPWNTVAAQWTEQKDVPQGLKSLRENSTYKLSPEGMSSLPRTSVLG